MQARELLDETFDTCQQGRYDLLLWPTYAGISVGVHESQRRRFVGYIDMPYPVADASDWRSALEACQRTYPWLVGQFRSVRLGWQTPSYTMLPEEYFVPEQAKLLLQRVVGIGPLDVIYFNRVESPAIMLFAIPAELLHAVTQLQEQFTVVSLEGTLARLALRCYAHSSGVLLLTEGSALSLIVVHEGALQAVLPFYARSAEDVLYRVLAALRALDMDPNGTLFYVFGPGVNMTEHGAPSGATTSISRQALVSVLGRYMPPLESAPQLDGFTFCYLTERVREERMPLFSLMLCE